MLQRTEETYGRRYNKIGEGQDVANRNSFESLACVLSGDNISNYSQALEETHFFKDAQRSVPTSPSKAIHFSDRVLRRVRRWKDGLLN